MGSKFDGYNGSEKSGGYIRFIPVFTVLPSILLQLLKAGFMPTANFDCFHSVSADEGWLTVQKNPLVVKF